MGPGGHFSSIPRSSFLKGSPAHSHLWLFFLEYSFPCFPVFPILFFSSFYPIPNLWWLFIQVPSYSAPWGKSFFSFWSWELCRLNRFHLDMWRSQEEECEKRVTLWDTEIRKSTQRERSVTWYQHLLVWVRERHRFWLSGKLISFANWVQNKQETAAYLQFKIICLCLNCFKVFRKKRGLIHIRKIEWFEA